MFKKDFNVAERTDMSNKERKKFKKTLLKHFKQNSIQEYFLQVDKFYSETVEKKKYIIICNEQNPLWVDSTGKGDFFPTVYSLSLYPKLVQNYLKITNKLLKKMRKLPMVNWSDIKNKSELEEFKADEVVGLLNEQGDLMGVGAMACGKDDDLDDEEPAVYVLQHVQDKMFEHGDMELKDLDLDKPKEKVVEDETKVDSESEDDDDDNDYFMGNFVKNIKKGNQGGGLGGGQGKQKQKQKQKKKEEAAPAPKGKKGKKRRRKKNKGNDDFTEKEKEEKIDEIKETKDEPQEKIDHFADEGKGKKGKKKRRKNKGKNKEGGNQPKGGNATKIMDDLIVEAFLNSLILSVNDKNLPMETTKFWNEHVVPCKSGDINIKESSFKKLGKFFKAMEKKGYIKYKEASKKSSTSEVQSICRHHDEINSWEPTINEVQKDSEDEEDSGKGGKSITRDCTVEEFCTPQKIFEKYIEVKPEPVSYKQFTKQIEAYLKENKMIVKNKVEVTQELANNFGIEWEQEDNSKIIDDEVDTLGLDVEDEDTIAEAKVSKKRTSKKVEAISLSKAEFFEHLNKKVKFGFKVTNPKGEVVRESEGKFPGMTIYAEKQHGKMITRVTGLELYFSKLEKLVKELDSKLSASFKLKDIMINKESTKEIRTNGIFFDELKDYFTLELKIDEEEINTVNKIDKKKKKQTMMGY